MGDARRTDCWHIDIAAATCIQCAGCVAVCPTQALDMYGLELHCDDARCIGCDFCGRFCPVAALRLEKRPPLPGPHAVDAAS